ncbi:hypothetical protein [Streptomyces sp. NBC_01716]|uniref:hypothetical protein n=1 Tax=Streptomyces sp. NBC_01716 TaxID=2975917 RepID=UPI002E30D563|nr:hypothetical protein [Streptomyces sp. NBC_01716]
MADLGVGDPHRSAQWRLAKSWLIEAAAAGTTRIRVKMAGAVVADEAHSVQPGTGAWSHFGRQAT